LQKPGGRSQGGNWFGWAGLMLVTVDWWIVEAVAVPALASAPPASEPLIMAIAAARLTPILPITMASLPIW
jgi:hypothetical protein